MKILVLQHIPIEDPGYIKVLMQQDQCELTTIELDAGEKIPNNLAEFDANAMYGRTYGYLDGSRISLADRRKNKDKRVCL